MRKFLTIVSWAGIIVPIVAVGDTQPQNIGELEFATTPIYTARQIDSKLEDVSASGSYTNLENKPLINGVELEGNKTASDLGLATADEAMLAVYYPDGSVTNMSQITTNGIAYAVGEDGGAYVVSGSGLSGHVVLPWKVTITGAVYKVTAIGESAFDDNYYDNRFTSFTAPITVKSVVGGSFSTCGLLTSVNFPSATSIGDHAFLGCSSLTSVNFPSATSIGDYAFNNCGSLTSVNFPSVTSIGDDVFTSCGSLASVNFPSATRIGSRAFSTCGLLTSVNFPSATSIGNYAFNSCGLLTSVNFPSATSIGNYAIARCSSLTSVNLPSVTNIGSRTFYLCGSLATVDFGSFQNSSVPLLSGTAFESVPTSCKIIIPLGMYDEWIEADGWKDLYAVGYQFVGYANAADVAKKRDRTDNIVAADEVAGGVTVAKTGESYVSPTGVYNLTSNKQDALTPSQMSAINDAVIKRQTVVIQTDGTIHRLDIIGTLTTSMLPDNEAHIIVGEGVTAIEEAFQQNNYLLESLYIPSSVTNVGSVAVNCLSLSDVYIAQGVTNINALAFQGSTDITNLVFEGLTLSEIKALPNYPWGLQSPEEVIKPGKLATQEWVMQRIAEVEGTISYEVDKAINGGGEASPFREEASSLVEFSDGTTQTYEWGGTISIDTMIAAGLQSSETVWQREVTAIKLGTDVTEIDVDTFAYCATLTNIAVGTSVTNIKELALGGILSIAEYNVQEIHIPPSVKEIGQNALGLMGALAENPKVIFYDITEETLPYVRNAAITTPDAKYGYWRVGIFSDDTYNVAFQKMYKPIAFKSDIPTKVSQLENDVGYITADEVSTMQENIKNWLHACSYFTWDVGTETCYYSVTSNNFTYMIAVTNINLTLPSNESALYDVIQKIGIQGVEPSSPVQP